MAEAAENYRTIREWQVAEIRRAVEAADAGERFVEHEVVAAWLQSWGTESELPRPR